MKSKQDCIFLVQKPSRELGATGAPRAPPGKAGGRSLAWPPDLRLPSQTASWARPPASTEFTFHLATYEREAQEQREPEAAKRALQLPSDLSKELGSAGNVSFDNSS